MTPMQRVLTALGHRAPDRVPLFLLLTMHGAKELGLSIESYFSKGENVAEGQLRLQRKFGHDCLYPFFYAAVETEAMGGEVLYRDDGPPNSGEPIVGKSEEIGDLSVPDVENVACLRKVLEAVSKIKEEVGDRIPIIGVVMSPFSLPVMQMGFESYLRLIYERRDLFRRLMDVNERFCVRWANAQLKAGATAICYFDPVSSPTVVPRRLYRETGFETAVRTLARIRGPVAVHMASGRGLAIVDDLVETGAQVVGVGCDESLTSLKHACQNRIGILGNLNGVAMAGWTPEQAEKEAEEAISQAGRGGGFILSDSHGEIPFQVPDDVLLAIAETVRRRGRYPLDRNP